MIDSFRNTCREVELSVRSPNTPCIHCPVWICEAVIMTPARLFRSMTPYGTSGGQQDQSMRERESLWKRLISKRDCKCSRTEILSHDDRIRLQYHALVQHPHQFIYKIRTKSVRSLKYCQFVHFPVTGPIWPLRPAVPRSISYSLHLPTHCMHSITFC